MKPDVYAAANTKLPDALYDEKRVERPVVFAGNRLVIAVPADSDRVGSVEDLSGPDVSVVAGAPAVPVGSYTREVLSRLPPATERAILANVRSSEPDVKGVVAKLIQGAADAGFVYVTDVEAADGKLKAIELPESLRPERRVRRCGREGSEGARGRAGVHRRPPRRRGSRTPCARPASSRRRDEGWRVRRAAWCCRWPRRSRSSRSPWWRSSWTSARVACSAASTTRVPWTPCC